MVLDSKSKTAVRTAHTNNAFIINSQQYCTLSIKTNRNRLQKERHWVHILNDQQDNLLPPNVPQQKRSVETRLVAVHRKIPPAECLDIASQLLSVCCIMPALSVIGLVTSTSTSLLWLQKYLCGTENTGLTNIQSRKFWIITVTLNTALQSFHETLQLMMMLCHQIKLGCRSASMKIV